MRSVIDIVIIGAGPYGLSLAAHLRSSGATFRIFGNPMQTWREAMPPGMYLKSEGFASSLSDPEGELTLGAYCAEVGEPYADTGIPVPLKTFVAYGEAFQRRFVPELESRMVMHVAPAPHGFDLRLADGETVAARRVVIAAGIRAFAYTPPALQALPPDLISHSADYGDAAHLAGRSVVILGAGSSAVDVAALLLKHNATVTAVTRRPKIRFQSPLGERSLRDKLRAPMTGLGPGWKSVLCVKAPLLFHAMPEQFRVDVVRRYLGPAPSWVTRTHVDGKISVVPRSTVAEVLPHRAGVRLVVSDSEGSRREIDADHIVAATGYKVSVDRLNLLDARIRSGLRTADGAPALSRQFESSMPGLYFVGTAAANSFGPMLRFAYGADFAARRLAKHLARPRIRPHTVTPPAFSNASIAGRSP
jgi:thioredoxin reductase